MAWNDYFSGMESKKEPLNSPCPPANIFQFFCILSRKTPYYHGKSSRRRWLTAVLSHHRAYRSVHGGFNSWRVQTDRLWLSHKNHCLSVFLLLMLCWPLPFPIHTSISCGCLPPGVQNIRVSLVWCPWTAYAESMGNGCPDWAGQCR